jgi:hypothetical protein
MAGAAHPGDIPLTRDNLLFLQRTIGNRGVVRLMRKKGRLNQQGSKDGDRTGSMAGRVMRMAEPESSPADVVDGEFQGSSQAGQPLDNSTRDSMEGAFGRDLGTVRTHTDAEAGRASDALGARAFTVGQDIYFARGEYQPGTAGGDRLLAHELTHTIQQDDAHPPGPQTKLTVSQPGDPDEREAEAVADRVTQGGDAQIANISTRPAMLQRRPVADGGTSRPSPADRPAPDASVVDLKSDRFENPPEPIATQIAEGGRKGAEVAVRFGSLAEGRMVIRREKDKYQAKRQPLMLSHPLFREAAAQGLKPRLLLEIKNGEIRGRIGLEGDERIESAIKKAPPLIGLAGFDLTNLPQLENKIESGTLKFGARGIPVKLGGAFSGTVTIVAEDAAITFEGSATVVSKGLATGTLDLNRSAEGLITGKVTVALDLPKNFSGALDVAWDGQAITGEGKAGYQGEKLSGEVTLRLMEKGEAEQLAQAKKAPQEEGASPKEGEPAKAPAPAKGKSRSVDYVVFGEGELTFAFTDWLNGAAQVIVDQNGYVTIIGKITPQKEFILFEQNDHVKPLFKAEARASYGIPVVGNIFIFANIGMEAFAKMGPAKFYNIIVEGTYSTDPEKNKDFSIRGTLNISAAAGLKLRGEAGAGLEVLDHDIKAGAGIDGIAGIRGYAEATPIIGYRENAKPGEDKKGEFFIRGELEIAAQPFLGLSGDLFVELDSPWWSPAPDKKWTWPLGDKEWPIGGTFGIKAGVDYVFGSNQLPTVEFGKVDDFSADKFMTDLYNDDAKSKSGETPEQKAGWREKNEKQADAPKPESNGDGAPGKAGDKGPATAKPGGTKQPGKPAKPDDRTAEGKSVKEHQDEATKSGKKPPSKDAGKGAGKEEPSQKDGDEQKHDDELIKGLAALDAVTARYAKDGATREEVETGVKSVRRKFKVFKSIEVIDGGETWDYDYVASPGKKKKGPVKVDDSKIVDKDKVDPSVPPEAVPPVIKSFDLSRRGNTRLFATDKNNDKWVWKKNSDTSATQGHWQKIKDDSKIKEAEEEAGRWLEAHKPQFLSLVKADKAVSEHGADVAGLGQETDPASAGERLFIGEAKLGSGKQPTYFPFTPGDPETNKISAITTNLESAIAGITDEARERGAQEGKGNEYVDRVNAALKSGKVTIYIFLKGKARIGKTGRGGGRSTFTRVKMYVLNELRRILGADPYNLKRDELNEVINNVEVKIEKL